MKKFLSLSPAQKLYIYQKAANLSGKREKNTFLSLYFPAEDIRQIV